MSDEPSLISERGERAEASPDQKSTGRWSIGVSGVVKILASLVVVGLLVYFYLRGDLTQENLKRITAALPTSVFLPVYLVLPLFGFPINVLVLASGMKYGFGPSLAIAAVGMGLHTLAAWHLAHSLFRKRLENWLEGTRFELPTIPENHQVWFTTVFVTIPGLPYAVKLYSLALTNLPFRRYLPIVWLVHVAGAIPLIFIGVAAVELNVIWLIALGVLGILTILATNWLKNWYAESLEHSSESHESPAS